MINRYIDRYKETEREKDGQIRKTHRGRDTEPG